MMNKPITLVMTCAEDSAGSMRRYAFLVRDGFQTQGAPVKIVRLAPSALMLSFFPSALRSGLHHAMILLKGFVLLRRKHTVYHVLDGSHAYVLGLMPRAAKRVVTCHDFIPLMQMRGESEGTPSGIARRIIEASFKALKTADGLVFDSAKARDYLIPQNILPAEKCHLIHLPLSSSFAEFRGYDPTLRRKGFILHVGHNAEYKNRMGVVSVFNRLKDSWDGALYLAGPSPSNELVNRVEELGLTSRVQFIEDPSDEKLLALYDGADLFMFPSIEEGYGWPPLEATSRGCPVVATRCGAVVEVLSEQGVLAYDVGDESGLAEGCLKLLKDKGLCQQLVEEGQRALSSLSPERYVQELMVVYGDLI